MSKPIPPGGLPPRLPPCEQVRAFADLYRDSVDPAALDRVRTRARDLSLPFAGDELCVIAALDTPPRVQEFLNTRIYYNYDHDSADSVETAMPPREVLRTGLAHCFEGALFAYAVNFLHGHDPRWVLLEASQDSQHNLVLFRDPQSGQYGAIAHSGYPNLIGRPAQFESVRAIVDSFYPFYYSDISLDPNDITLTGFSEPFDLIERYGTDWIASEGPMWDIYYTYIDDSVAFHGYSSPREELGPLHPYPLIRALQEGWLRVGPAGRVRIAREALGPALKDLWGRFWETYDPPTGVPRGEANLLDREFLRRTGTTPLDLEAMVDELQEFLDRGYRIEQLLTRRSNRIAHRSQF